MVSAETTLGTFSERVGGSTCGFVIALRPWLRVSIAGYESGFYNKLARDFLPP